MKIQHFIIIFLILILPFSIICRNTMTNYKLMLRDQVRLNNVIDSATQDALDMLIELNDEFQMLYFNERFNITQELAKESVKSFFQTLAINFNMPYRGEETESYFSIYVPAIVIVSYDGFFIYSVDESASGYAYKMSPKIPYTYYDEDSGCIVHFTLGDYVKLYTNNNVYEGELTCDYQEAAEREYNVYYTSFYTDELGKSGTEALTLEYLPGLTSDMSVIVEALCRVDGGLVPDFLKLKSSGDPDYYPLRQDYGSGDEDASEFHEIRRKTIINLIQDTLREEMNEHNTYATFYDVKYNFALPEITEDEWRNSINDISIMSFIQGMPVGVDGFYNNYALSGSRIIQTSYIYGTDNGNKYYHTEYCTLISDFIKYLNGEIDTLPEGALQADNIFINRVEAAENGYYPCATCSP